MGWNGLHYCQTNPMIKFRHQWAMSPQICKVDTFFTHYPVKIKNDLERITENKNRNLGTCTIKSFSKIVCSLNRFKSSWHLDIGLSKKTVPQNLHFFFPHQNGNFGSFWDITQFWTNLFPPGWFSAKWRLVIARTRTGSGFRELKSLRAAIRTWHDTFRQDESPSFRWCKDKSMAIMFVPHCDFHQACLLPVNVWSNQSYDANITGSNPQEISTNSCVRVRTSSDAR